MTPDCGIARLYRMASDTLNDSYIRVLTISSHVPYDGTSCHWERQGDFAVRRTPIERVGPA
jgi:hypothetical protein